MVRKLLKDAQAPVGKRLVVPYASEFFVRPVQVRLAFPERCLVCQAGQTFEPEFANGTYLIAFFREHHRDEPRRKIVFPANLRGDPEQ